MALNHWIAQGAFLKNNLTLANNLNHRTAKNIMNSELLQRGYECYWKRDLKAARAIFKAVMKTGHGAMKDWKYMLPSLLPYSLHLRLLGMTDK